MKMLMMLIVVITSAASILPQSKNIETGLYLVAAKDSCSDQNKNLVVYLSDTLCLMQKPVITKGDIEYCETVKSKLDNNEVYALNIKLNASAALKFKKVTEQNVGKMMAMIIDNKVVMAAVIRDPVTSGRLTISGQSEEETLRLGKMLEEEIHKK